MMMAICSKFGTRDSATGVAVGEGIDVAVRGIGVGVCVAVAKGTGDGVIGGVEDTQAASKTKRRTQKPKRFIRLSP